MSTFKYEEAFKMAFELMPPTFSTLIFNNVCRELEIPEEVVTSSAGKHFLQRKSKRVAKSLWSKNSVKPAEYDSRKMHSMRSSVDDFPIYEKALAEMPVTFTSSDIASKAKSMGANPKHTQQGAIGFWLSEREDIERLTRNTWMFTHPAKAEPITLSSMITEKQAVDLLKFLGYRLMKPTTQWEEL
jgi:hypothetical protein